MITIKKFTKKDTKEVANLVGDVFIEFNSKEGGKKAVDNYIQFYKSNNEKMKKMFEMSPMFFVAVDNEKIIGVIRGDKNRIFNLFVLGSYHGKGVGSKLLSKFEKEIKKNDGKVLRVRSSLFAENFYKKMGYKKTTGRRNFFGLKVQPMKKFLFID